MANQLAENARRVTVTMSKDLVEMIDKIARDCNRDRTYIIRHFIETGFAELRGSETKKAPEIELAIEGLLAEEQAPFGEKPSKSPPKKKAKKSA